ncbi:MAG: hypothetical protein KDA74_18150 [Planctomycetaceae bacterium]|nr:hypothetical protein [Planctomycetaceae bacterium]
MSQASVASESITILEMAKILKDVFDLKIDQSNLIVEGLKAGWLDASATEIGQVILAKDIFPDTNAGQMREALKTGHFPDWEQKIALTILYNDGAAANRQLAEWIKQNGMWSRGIDSEGNWFFYDNNSPKLPECPFIVIDVQVEHLNDQLLAEFARLAEPCIGLNWAYLSGISKEDLTGAAFRNLLKIKSLGRLSFVKTSAKQADFALLGDLPLLREISIGDSYGDTTAKEFLNAISKMPRLINVGINNCPTRDEDLMNLLQLPALESVYVNSFLLTNTVFDHLAGITTLQELALHSNQFTDAIWQKLTSCSKLKRLQISAANLIVGTGIRALAQLPDLIRVNLAALSLQDASLAEIAELSQIRELIIEANPITDAGIAHLYQMSNLKQLGLRQTQVTSVGISALKSALPNCKVESDV